MFIVDLTLQGRNQPSAVILGGAGNLSGNVPKGMRLIEVTINAYRAVAD